MTTFVNYKMKDFKTLLIFPPMTIYREDLSQPATSLPLGLAYIASYLREKNTCEVRIIDALTEGINNVKKTTGLRASILEKVTQV